MHYTRYEYDSYYEGNDQGETEKGHDEEEGEREEDAGDKAKTTQQGRRRKNVKVQTKSAAARGRGRVMNGRVVPGVTPFASFWYIGGLGELRKPLLEWWQQKSGGSVSSETSLARCAEELPTQIRKLERYVERKNGKKQKALAWSQKAKAKAERRRLRKSRKKNEKPVT